mmetsp:Transcript_91466/g.248096  ORF Transcript_91466/g.248096 Transcript_91466/m.248096 type:complete len:259 (-) Transcript_91466:722-1498(-)
MPSRDDFDDHVVDFFVNDHVNNHVFADVHPVDDHPIEDFQHVDVWHEHADVRHVDVRHADVDDANVRDADVREPHGSSPDAILLERGDAWGLRARARRHPVPQGGEHLQLRRLRRAQRGGWRGGRPRRRAQDPGHRRRRREGGPGQRESYDGLVPELPGLHPSLGCRHGADSRREHGLDRQGRPGRGVLPGAPPAAPGRTYGQRRRVGVLHELQQGLRARRRAEQAVRVAGGVLPECSAGLPEPEAPMRGGIGLARMG